MSAPLRRRAFRILTQNPEMRIRELQETLGCSLASAKIYHAAYRKQTREEREALERQPMPMRRPVLELVKGTTARVPAEELPKETQEIVVDELRGMMEYITATRKRMMREHEALRPIEHSQFANALQSVAKTLQTLCDTYPGIASLTGKQNLENTGFSNKDLADVNRWMDSA